MDERAAGEIVERRRQARLVAAAGAAKRRLRDPRVLADQRQHGETAGAKIETADTAREGLERGLLRETQVKADEIGERAEAQRLRRRRPLVPSRLGQACRHPLAFRSRSNLSQLSRDATGESSRSSFGPGTRTMLSSRRSIS